MTSSARPEGFAQSATLVARPSAARVRSRGASDDAARAHGRGETFELPGSSLSRSGLVGTASAAKGGSSTLGEATAKLRSATAASLARRSGAKIDPGGGRFYGTDDANANGGGASSSKKTASPSSASTGAASTPSSGRATSESPRPSQNPAASSVLDRRRPPPGCVVVHVLDEARNERRDFTCDLKTLLGQMRYFKQHLAADVETRPEASAELSVHCDIPTFEWLVDHAEGRDPRVTTTNCVALMISSDFLRMDALTEKCADFVAARAHEICALGADLANLARGLLEKIARRMSDDALESLLATSDEDVVHVAPSGGRPEVREKNDSDSRRALAATLYRVKTEALIASRRADAGVTIARCAACGLLFSEKHRFGLRCPRARRHVDYHGAVIARHAPMKDFDVNAHIERLRARGHAWRDVYWHVWGVTHVIDRCGRCGAVVPASELAQCEYHPKPATFDDDADASVGTFACCGSRARRQPRANCMSSVSESAGWPSTPRGLSPSSASAPL